MDMGDLLQEILEPTFSLTRTEFFIRLRCFVFWLWNQEWQGVME